MAASPQHLTLTANVEAVLTFDINAGKVEILNLDGTAEVYVSVDNTPVTIGANGFHVLPAAISSLELDDKTTGNTVVRLRSAGTPRMSVRVW